MRWRVGFAILAAAALVTTPALTQEDSRPNLYTSSISEPPDVLVVGNNFVSTFTISNEGPGAARSSIVRAYLSTGRGRGNGDRRLQGRRRIPSLRPGGQHTGRRLFRIPAGVPEGTYYLVICADDTKRVDESNDRNNCVASGQRMSVVSTAPPPGGTPGPVGAAGPPGPKGAVGPAGASPDMRRLPRRELKPAEGETAEEDVLDIGDFTFRYECQNADGTATDFARLHVLHDDEELTTQGPVEENFNFNVPPGTEADLLEVSRQDDTSAVADDPNTPNTDESETNINDSGFGANRLVVVAQDGTELIVEAWAAVDSLGVGEPGPDNRDECVYGGRVIVP